MNEEIKQLPTIEILYLRDLNIGDRFCAVSDKKKVNRYEIRSNGKFNRRHGSATRMCWNERTKDYESKSGRLQVIKLKSHE